MFSFLSLTFLIAPAAQFLVYHTSIFHFLICSSNHKIKYIYCLNFIATLWRGLRSAHTKYIFITVWIVQKPYFYVPSLACSSFFIFSGNINNGLWLLMIYALILKCFAKLIIPTVTKPWSTTLLTEIYSPRMSNSDFLFKVSGALFAKNSISFLPFS
jgi:hypothetical protein